MHPPDTRKEGREELQNIIETCKSIENRSLDPFQIDVHRLVDVVKKYFPEWEHPEDLCLDAETIQRLASIIKLQSEWVKHRSNSLYTDPFLLEEKLTQIDKEEIVKIFLRSWRPIVELEQITLHSLEEAMEYWEELVPLEDRWQEPQHGTMEGGLTTREKLIEQRILGDQEFSEELEKFWARLKTEVEEKGEDDKIRYWDFIGAESYPQTVRKAFLTSFLVTYGYATLEIHPLEEEIFIKPFQTPQSEIREKQLVSIPIAVNKEDWERWKRGALIE
ncbi:MAG: hypothetical protein ACOC6H_00285 [Thermoproteota archaeon]